MGNKPSAAPTFSFNSVGHETSNVRRALFDWPGNGNDCASSTGARFDILWGVTMLLLVAAILRQWYLERKARKAIDDVDRLMKVDLESQKIATSNTRG
ncbi:uncharacterized protein ARMOST_20641 [Armillaria ostoyae]|uniref:Uncharacterized protein n=1 Tax=Armillaria ostoyae TaxID=47428 RepID=A0A284S7W2_ARMOS|nr:uncharacterized protein ARMOST_20641 [Armillaria ostoyae]